MVPDALFSPNLPRLVEEEGQYKRGGAGQGFHCRASRPGFAPLPPSLVSHLAHPRLPP